MISVKKEPRRSNGLTLQIDDKAYEVRIVRLGHSYVLTELASGNQYSVNAGDVDAQEPPRCTCKGFEHRQACKHLDQLTNHGLIC